MINLGALAKLKKFSSLTTHTIAVEHVAEIAGIFGKNVDMSMAESLLEAFRKDAVEPMVDWCIDAENIAKLQNMVRPQVASILIECPGCSELSTFVHGEVPQVNPHVICRVCKAEIPLS